MLTPVIVFVCIKVDAGIVHHNMFVVHSDEYTIYFTWYCSSFREAVDNNREGGGYTIILF